MNPRRWKISDGKHSDGKEKNVEELRKKVNELIGIGLAHPAKCVPHFVETGININIHMTNDMLDYRLQELEEAGDEW